MKKYKVYYHKVPSDISGYKHDKYYIGITCKKYVSDRWGKNGNGYKTQIFYRAIQKYGWNNMEHKILFDNLSESEAKILEEDLISILKTSNPQYGYNYTKGGDGIKECSKIKIHPVYCKELNVLFKTVGVASLYTGDNVNTITNHCRNNIICPGRNLKFTYCYIENMYKYYDISKMIRTSKPVVNLQDGQLFGNYNIASKILNIPFYRNSILTFDEYIQKKDSGKLYKKNYLMYAKDYLLLFDMTKIS